MLSVCHTREKLAVCDVSCTARTVGTIVLSPLLLLALARCRTFALVKVSNPEVEACSMTGSLGKRRFSIRIVAKDSKIRWTRRQMRVLVISETVSAQGCKASSDEISFSWYAYRKVYFMKAFRRAIRSGPADLVVHYEYGVNVTRLPRRSGNFPGRCSLCLAFSRKTIAL